MDEYARSAALRAIVIRVVTGNLPRADAIAYYASLLRGGLPREPGWIWDSLAGYIVDLNPAELLGPLRQAYEEGLCDSAWVSIEEAEHEADLTPAETLRCHGGLIEDTAAAMSWWACFKPEERSLGESDDEDGWDELDEDAGDDEGPAVPYVRAEPKIGRNEPCPCGSGKKHKKCCGGQTATPRDPAAE
mgnify:CR=1 FL=1